MYFCFLHKTLFGEWKPPQIAHPVHIETRGFFSPVGVNLMYNFLFSNYRHVC